MILAYENNGSCRSNKEIRCSEREPGRRAPVLDS